MKHISLFACLLCSALLSAQTNVLLSHPSYASSGDATLGNDGNSGTRWESEQGVDPQWWVVNMQTPQAFNTVQIIWEGAYAKTFTLEVSNDSINWTTVATVANDAMPNTQLIAIQDTSAQYLRFTGTERGTQYGYSFWEISAFVKTPAVLTTLTMNPAASVAKKNATVDLGITTLDQYDQPIEVEVTYDVQPAGAGSVTDGVYTALQTGLATITATAGELSQSASIFCYAGENISLDKVAQGTGDNDIARLTDGDDATEWQASRDGASVDTTVSCVLDLTAEYNLELVAIHFEGACSDAYTLETSADNVNWNSAYVFEGTLGINNHTDYIFPGGEKALMNANNVRYVRFTSTKSSTQWGMKIFEMSVYGVESSATAIAETRNSEFKIQNSKFLKGGRLYIRANGQTYDVTGVNQ